MSSTPFAASLSAVVTIGLIPAAFAAPFPLPEAFQDPATAAWGGWTRGAPGTIHAGWNVFDSTADRTPDLGQHNLSTALLVANNPGAFVTGSRNIYSLTDVNDFSGIFVPTTLAAGRFTVAVQISVLGNDLDAASLRLNGVPWTSRTVLATGTGLAPPGVGAPTGGVDNEYLFLWSGFERATDRDVFALEFRSLSVHNSLDALTIDAGPAPAPPAPVSVPIPGALGLLAGLLGIIGRGRLPV
jgi:hypothetical protein